MLVFYIYLDPVSFPLPLSLLPDIHDYRTMNKTLTFSSSKTSDIFTVEIVDDDIVEVNEEFSASLTTIVNGLVLSQPSTIVLIIDNEGVCVCVVCVFVHMLNVPNLNRPLKILW